MSARPDHTGASHTRSPFGPFGGIDALRGVSILAVMLTHLELLAPLSKVPADGGLPSWLFRALFRSGYYGVNVFFVISGFLIASVVLARWRALPLIEPRHFWRLRFARIAPSLLLLLALLSALHLAGVPGFVIDANQASLGRVLFATLTWHVNWLDAHVTIPDAWGVLWSLCIEEVFYLALPLLALTARRGWVLVALLMACIVAGPWARTDPSANDLWHGHGYFSCFGEIATGVLTAWWVHRHPLSVRARRIAWLVAVPAFVLAMGFRASGVFLWLKSMGLQVNLIAFGTAALLAAITSGAQDASQGGRLLAPLRWLGRASYETYLFHMVVLGLVFAYLPRPASTGALLALYAVAVAICGLAGHLIHRFFSVPLNARLRASAHVNARRQPSPAVSVPTISPQVSPHE